MSKTISFLFSFLLSYSLRFLEEENGTHKEAEMFLTLREVLRK